MCRFRLVPLRLKRHIVYIGTRLSDDYLITDDKRLILPHPFFHVQQNSAVLKVQHVVKEVHSAKVAKK